MEKWKIDSARKITEGKPYFQRAITILLLGMILLVVIAQFTKENNGSIVGLLCIFGGINIVIIALMSWANYIQQRIEQE